MKIAGKKIGLSTQIFAAMLLGAVLGIVIGEPMTKVGFIGTIWLNCIKMIVVPMVLVTLSLIHISLQWCWDAYLVFLQ